MFEEKETARPRGTDSAKVIQVIRTRSMRGYGTSDDLCRTVTQFWTLSGEFLAEIDPDCELLEDD